MCSGVCDCWTGVSCSGLGVNITVADWDWHVMKYCWASIKYSSADIRRPGSEIRSSSVPVPSSNVSYSFPITFYYCSSLSILNVLSNYGKMTSLCSAASIWNSWLSNVKSEHCLSWFYIYSPGCLILPTILDELACSPFMNIFCSSFLSPLCNCNDRGP